MRSKVIQGETLEQLRSMRSGSVSGIITSPPYYQKLDYGHQLQHGLEPTLNWYLFRQSLVLAELLRVTVENGAAYINIGETMCNCSPIRTSEQSRKRSPGAWSHRRTRDQGFRQKEVLGVPFRYAETARSVGWHLRQILIWDKGQAKIQANSDAAPLSHECVLHLVKQTKGGRIYSNTTPLPSTVLRFGVARGSDLLCPLPKPMIHTLLSTFIEPTLILDPYCGSGSVLEACDESQVCSVGIDLSPVGYAALVLQSQFCNGSC